MAAGLEWKQDSCHGSGHGGGEVVPWWFVLEVFFLYFFCFLFFCSFLFSVGSGGLFFFFSKDVMCFLLYGYAMICGGVRC